MVKGFIKTSGSDKVIRFVPSWVDGEIRPWGGVGCCQEVTMLCDLMGPSFAAAAEDIKCVACALKVVYAVLRLQEKLWLGMAFINDFSL